MACESVVRRGQTAEDREREIRDALRKLEAGLENGSVQVRIGFNGAATFAGWNEAERGGMNDACAVRRLEVDGSFAWRTARAKAEAGSGPRFNFATAEAGWHTHDGRTWEKH